MTRHVTLALVDSGGAVLGALPPFHVEQPYWQEAHDVVLGARLHFGVEVSVLRILSIEAGLRRGGKVTYLAEVDRHPDTPLTPVEVDVTDHPLRPDYAKPGGPSRSLEWARQALGTPNLSSRQLRSWNLSTIWRLETAAGCVFLKQVPRFFFHEAAVLSYLDLIRAADGHGRMLLDEILGGDLYGADLATRKSMVQQLFAIQARAVGDVDALLAAAVPDRRDLTGLGDQPWLAGRLALVGSCGMPNTLVHGDFHPGNVRGTATAMTIIDWGDSFIGHPAFDILRVTGDLDPAEAQTLIAMWVQLWRQLVPGCDPQTAVEALRPVAALRNASVYANFLANIEPDEHPYHAEDVPFWLAEADRLARC